MEQEEKISGMRKYCVNCPKYRMLIGFTDFVDTGYIKDHKNDKTFCGTIELSVGCKELLYKNEKVVLGVNGEDLYEVFFNHNEKDCVSQRENLFLDTHDCPLKNNDDRCVYFVERYTDSLKKDKV